jgi:hypothetical protein
VSADGAPTRHNIYCPTTHHQKEDDMKGCQKIIFSVDADAMSAANLDEQNYLRIIPKRDVHLDRERVPTVNHEGWITSHHH